MLLLYNLSQSKENLEGNLLWLDGIKNIIFESVSKGMLHNYWKIISCKTIDIEKYKTKRLKIHMNAYWLSKRG